MTAAKDMTQIRTPGLLQRFARATIRTAVTLIVIAAALFAVKTGSDELTRRADAAPAPAPAPLMPVETTPITLAPGYDITRSFVGQVEPRRTTSISFELSGRLNDIIVDEGDTVAAGQHVATLDTQLLDADRARLQASQTALEAQLRFAEQTVERQSQLSDQGFASQAARDEALSRADELRARIAEVEAALLTNSIQTEKSQIHAPFAGRVTERRVDGGESIAPGQALIDIVEDGRPQLRIGVPLDLSADDLTTATVDIGGTEYQAELLTLRPDVDPATRTRTALFEVATDDNLAFGQTARVLLSDTIETPGLWVPVTTLKEGLRGQWTLLAVDTDDTVRSLTVQVLHSQRDRVFVAGAFPQDIRLITTGPQRVTVGQTVDPQPATGS
ncbi:efflux RND transporter periplasmic adaptor subunit [Yoonia sp. 2307UL14-13]|uniref:efflux RND transporter periplasmic adaptor subunit n=1 Tax=Yoonia sp. 2307UL14-13 TaxID=3126506 RepID=UPI0030AB34C2